MPSIGGLFVALAISLLVGLLMTFLAKRAKKTEDEKLHREYEKERTSRHFLQLRHQLDNLKSYLKNLYPKATGFFERYIEEKVQLYATMIVTDATSDDGWDFFDRQFLLVPDIENKRVYMIFHIFYCKKNSDGLFEDLDWPNDDRLTKRRALNENEKKALLYASVFDYRQYSDCHVCHTGDCLKHHDEHSPCHVNQPCEATCDVEGVHYFDSYDEKELEAELAKPTLDLDMDNDLGGSD